MTYKIANFKQFPIKDADNVTIDGKPFSARKLDLLRGFIHKLLGKQAAEWALPNGGTMIDGVLDAELRAGTINKDDLNGPAMLVFDSVVLMLVKPTDDKARRIYAHYQNRIEAAVMRAALVSHAIRTVLAGSLVANLAPDIEPVLSLNYSKNDSLKKTLSDLASKSTRAGDPALWLAIGLK